MRHKSKQAVLRSVDGVSSFLDRYVSPWPIRCLRFSYTPVGIQPMPNFYASHARVKDRFASKI